MLKSSLIEIIKSLDKNELKRFEDFIMSPYYNKKTTVIKLFQILKKHSPEFTGRSLEREEVWKNLFPGKKFNYGVMKNLIFDLQKLVFLFLGNEKIGSNNYIFQLNLLEALSEKNLDQQFEKNIKIYSGILKKQKINDTYFYEHTKLEGLKYNHFIAKAHRTAGNQYLLSFHKFLILDFLRQYFILNFNIEIYRKDFKKSRFDIHNIRPIIEALLQSVIHFQSDYSDSKEQDFYNKIILMYSNGYNMMNTGEVSYYFELKKLLDEYSVKLDMIEQYNIYNLLTSFCVNKSLAGDNSFYTEEFDLYKIILKKEAFTFYKDGYMNRLMYYNIARTGIKLKEFEWTIDFINTYKARLPVSSRDQTYLFTYAFIEFGKKDYIKALGILSGLSHYEVRDKPREKMLFLMLYYELGYVEQLLSFVDSCKHFAKNDKLLSDHFKKKFLNFVNCVFELSKIKFTLSAGDPATSLSVMIKSIREKDVSFKDWLLEKISSLA